MQSEDKIGLVQASLRYLTDALRPDDTVALCTYAGSVREILPPTGFATSSACFRRSTALTAGGSTAMASGIDLAYELASRTLVAGHESRVIVLSDGDANVGPTSPEQILRLIGRSPQAGITLSTVGFGNGNYKDTMMERFADKGDGNYSYIGSEQGREARVLGAGGRIAPGDRARREAPGRVRSGRGFGVSPDRLREPRCRRPGLPQRRHRRGRGRLGTQRHRALRRGPEVGPALAGHGQSQIQARRLEVRPSSSRSGYAPNTSSQDLLLPSPVYASRSRSSAWRRFCAEARMRSAGISLRSRASRQAPPSAKPSGSSYSGWCGPLAICAALGRGRTECRRDAGESGLTGADR